MLGRIDLIAYVSMVSYASALSNTFINLIGFDVEFGDIMKSEA